MARRNLGLDDTAASARGASIINVIVQAPGQAIQPAIDLVDSTELRAIPNTLDVETVTESRTNEGASDRAVE